MNINHAELKHFTIDSKILEAVSRKIKKLNIEVDGRNSKCKPELEVRAANEFDIRIFPYTPGIKVEYRCLEKTSDKKNNYEIGVSHFGGDHIEVRETIEEFGRPTIFRLYLQRPEEEKKAEAEKTG